MNEEEFTNIIQEGMAQILILALEQGFTFPLHVTTTSADGQGMTCIYPVADGDGVIVEEHLDPDGRRLIDPYKLVVREWDKEAGVARERALRLVVTAGGSPQVQ